MKENIQRGVKAGRFAEPSADTGIFVDDDRGGYDTGCGLWTVVSTGGGDVFRTDG